MTTRRLLACPSCMRHVLAAETACPFCGDALPAGFADAPAPRPPARRLTRAALYAFGATSVAVAAACGSSSDNGPTPTPAYGTPGMSLDSGGDGQTTDSSSGEEGGSGSEAGTEPESGTRADGGGNGGDAGADADSGSHSLYGSPGTDAGHLGHDGGVAPAYGISP
jgi:hypothetical protein